MALENNAQVALAAFAVGIGFGALARWSGFCLRGAVEDVLTRPDAPRARGFLLAIVVALIVCSGAGADRPARSFPRR